jgi:hypothetical protein
MQKAPRLSDVDVERYDAIFVPGGLAPMGGHGGSAAPEADRGSHLRPAGRGGGQVFRRWLHLFILGGERPSAIGRDSSQSDCVGRARPFGVTRSRTVGVQRSRSGISDGDNHTVWNRVASREPWRDRLLRVQACASAGEGEHAKQQGRSWRHQ